MKQAHLIGIGGIGMSALANLLHAKGIKITGSDAAGPSDLTKKLEEKGVKIFYEHKADNLNTAYDLVIYSEAVSQNNPEILAAQALNIEQKSYAKALGDITKDYQLILITGTHGKTTVTGMISHIALEHGLDPTIVIGSKMKELNNNNYRVGHSKLFIAEGCEYRRSFLNFNPDILVITNIELDHLDYFKNEEDYLNAFKEIIRKVPETGFIIINTNDEKALELTKNSSSTIITFNNSEADGIKLTVPGKHNRVNALSALKAMECLGINGLDAIKSFKNTWRRLEIVGELEGAIIYDDYAHHPTEIKASLQALREQYPRQKICAVFQPHQVSRTKSFAAEFAQAFTLADEVILSDIYAVRDSEEDAKNVSSQFLTEKITATGTKATYTGSLEKTKNFIKENRQNWNIIVLMGAGDITKIREELL